MKNRSIIAAVALGLCAQAAFAVQTISLNNGTAINVPAGGSVTVPYTYIRPAADANNVFGLDSEANASGRLSFGTVTVAPQTVPTGAIASCPTQTATKVACGFFNATAPGVAVGNYVLAGSITINATAGAAAASSITFTNVSCADSVGNKIVGACVGQTVVVNITAPVADTAPVVAPLAATTLTAGVGSVPVNVQTVGTGAGTLGLACTIPATAPSNFLITAGANRTITAAAPVGANAPAIGLSCVPQAAITTATLSCAQTPTPAAALAPLTALITCPASTATAPTATIAATATLTAGAGTVPVTVATAGVATASLALACTVPAGTSSYAITAGANRTIAAPATLGLNAPAIGVSCVPAAAATTATVSCAQTATPAGAALPALTSVVTCPAVVTAVSAGLASGPLTLPAFTVGAGSSSSNLTFTGTAGGSVACAFNPAAPGYTATPNPLTLTGTTSGTVAVTYSGAAAGTFTGTLVCTVAAPGTGGPFTYNVSTTVNGVVVVPQVQVPALGNISLMLLIAGFLGLGAVLVGRRQA